MLVGLPVVAALCVPLGQQKQCLGSACGSCSGSPRLTLEPAMVMAICVCPGSSCSLGALIGKEVLTVVTPFSFLPPVMAPCLSGGPRLLFEYTLSCHSPASLGCVCVANKLQHSAPTGTDGQVPHAGEHRALGANLLCRLLSS